MLAGPGTTFEAQAALAADIATVVGVGVAVVAGAVAAVQIAASKADQKRATAYELFRDYVRLCIEHPELSDYKETTGNIQDEQYYRFCSFLFLACEEILIACPRDENWVSACTTHLRKHRLSLRRFDDPEVRASYSARFLDLADAVRLEGFESAV
jgi:hypothetical protein